MLVWKLRSILFFANSGLAISLLLILTKQVVWERLLQFLQLNRLVVAL